jgi:membrane protease YdiL (CAAX protease family)
LVLLPKGSAEKALWIVLSVSAGFREELVYRGYLLRQFWRLTGHRMAGVVLQGSCYGAAHAALPWQIAVSVGCLGLLFGGVAAWRRTLVPGMLMHAAFDLAAVFARR